MTIQEKIQNKKTYLGIEFGSTRIKAVLIDDTFAPVASGSHDWQNRYENGVWTYSLDDITTGLQHCYASLAEDVKSKYGVVPTGYGAMGISGMMHGYMAFDKDDNPAGSVPHMEKYHHRTGGFRTVGTSRIQYPPALEHCAPLPGGAQRRGARQGYRAHQHPGRIYPLPADRKAPGSALAKPPEYSLLTVSCTTRSTSRR